MQRKKGCSFSRGSGNRPAGCLDGTCRLKLRNILNAPDGTYPVRTEESGKSAEYRVEQSTALWRAGERKSAPSCGGSFQGARIPACAPSLLPQWSRALSDRYGFAFCWSERHAACACGLGTFGLSDGLITAAGKAIRLGSVIVRKRFPPTRRTYSHHQERCLFHSSGRCRACMQRCPAGAISEKGHNKDLCKACIRSITAVHVEQKQLGFRVNSCGLCQTKVPCEAGNPTLNKNKDGRGTLRL